MSHVFLIQINYNTAQRNLDILLNLLCQWRHPELGVYMRLFLVKCWSGPGSDFTLTALYNLICLHCITLHSNLEQLDPAARPKVTLTLTLNVLNTLAAKTGMYDYTVNRKKNNDTWSGIDKQIKATNKNDALHWKMSKYSKGLKTDLVKYCNITFNMGEITSIH